jgi:hypothetical protein
MEAIGRSGNALSVSQENDIAQWIEANTSDDVVPRDHRDRCAVHFIRDDAEAELRRKLSEEELSHECWNIARDSWEAIGSGKIVRRADLREE